MAADSSSQDAMRVASRVTLGQAIARNPPALISAIFLSCLTVAAILGPILIPEAHAHPSENLYQSPSFSYWFGTDTNGKSVLYSVLTGARVSLLVGFFGAMISLFIGTSYGMIAGFAGGAVDAVMMRLVEILYAIPRVLLVMIFIFSFDGLLREWMDGLRLRFEAGGFDSLSRFMAWLRSYSRILILTTALGLIEWLTMARLIRGQVLVLKEQQFVQASRALGRRPLGIMWSHLLPNLRNLIITYLTLTMAAVILDESFLSFLGLGIEAPAASWGSLLHHGAKAINPIQIHWWLLLFPAVFMSLTLIALNFIGDSLRRQF
ncbi:MAG: ABC transporter permease [Verrucomicrobiota bacterium]